MKHSVLPTTFSRRLGALLQRERENRNLTQAALAERADLSLKYLAEIEGGRANVTVSMLERLSTSLNWDPWRSTADGDRLVSSEVYELLETAAEPTREHVSHVVDWLTALQVALRAPRVLSPEGEESEREVAPPRRGRPRRRDASSASPHDANAGSEPPVKHGINNTPIPKTGVRREGQ